MKRGIYLANTGNPAELLNYAVTIDGDPAWDGLFLMDHLQISEGDGLDVHNPWVLLGAIASHTARLTLGVVVSPISRRRPWQLAKEIVTADHLSRGRIAVGIGLGGFEQAEYRAFGDSSTVRDRAEKTDEALPVLDRMLRGEAVAHRGNHYAVDAALKPACVQQPRPPIWIAASPPFRQPLKRAARWDGVFCNLKIERNAQGETRLGQSLGPQTPDELRDYVGELRDRPNFDIVAMRHPDYPAAAYAEAGATWCLDLVALPTAATDH